VRASPRILAVYLAGVFIGALDTSILGPVLPAIAAGLRVSLTWTAWTVTAYTVAYVAMTALAGAAGDRHGRHRLFLLGLAGFGAASLLAALARSFALFVAARAVQGAAAGVVYPNAMAEGTDQFPPERRGMALGLFGAVFGLASIVGPNVGGALGQYFGWQAIFWINVPFALIVLGAGRALPGGRVRVHAIPDWLGGVGFAGFLATLLLALEAAGPAQALLAAACVLLLLLFVARQRHAATPFLDTRPLRSRSGVAVIAGAALIGYDLAAAVWVPTLAQQAFHFSELQSGVALMPAALSGAVLAGLAGVLVDRIGPRAVLQAGLAAGVGGGVLLALPRLTLADFFGAMILFGIATAFTIGAPLNRLGMALYREEQSGEALALMAVFRSVGLASGAVLMAMALAWRGFPAMFGSVAVASLVGAVAFSAVPAGRRVVTS
jgi:MFS family permease